MCVNDILNSIISAEREAGELILHAHNILAESKTGQRDVVTEYDRRVQKLLEQRILAAVPDARFFCEEMDEQDDLNAARLFIIDPIDGTMNFVHGFHHSCVSVAYAEHGTVMAAAVFNPYMNELFSAVRGGGAFLNGKPIHVDDSPLSDTVVCFGTSPYRPAVQERSFDLLRRLFYASLDIRREGSAELDLCSVAAGRAGLYVELNVSLWDYAAGSLIVTEAGGVCVREDGRELPFTAEKPAIAAGGRQAIRDYFDKVRPDDGEN